MLPGSNAITSADCTVTFGSSNDTAMLQVSEHDGIGGSMSRLPHAALDTNTGDGDHWDTDGKSLDDYGGEDVAKAIGIQRIGVNAGKVVAAGTYGTSGSNNSMVMRRTATGIDTATFGTAGLYQNSFGADDEVRDMAVLADDSIIVVGELDAAIGYAFKLTPNGQLDTTFSAGDGSNGWFTYDPAGTQSFEAVAVSPSGQIVIAGEDSGNFLAYAINSDGALDQSFGVGGIRTVDAGTATDHAEGIAFDSTGRPLLAGRRGAAGARESVIARLTTTGAVDTFGVGGVRSVDVVPGVVDALYDVAELPNGRIVGVGHSGSGTTQRAVLVGLTSAGTVDTGGFLAPIGYGTSALGNATQGSMLSRMQVHADGRFVAVGLAWDAVPDDDIVVSRFNPDGSKDTTFGTNGDFVVAVSGSRSGEDIAFGLDGKYLLAGEGGSTDFVTMRIEAAKFGDWVGGSQDWATGSGSIFAICLRAIGGSASAVWPVTGACTSADTTPWRAVPDQAAAGTKAATTSSTNSGTASFRFGGRASSTQLPGAYEARITFDVVAPAA